MKYITLLMAFTFAAFASETTTVGQWTRTDETNPMDGTKRLIVTTAAIGKPGDELTIRLTGKKLEIFIATDNVVALANGFLDAYNYRWVSVRVKLDDAAPAKQTWTISDDHEAMFTRNPVKLLNQLKSSSTLYVEYRPSEQIPTTIRFNLQGLTEVLSH
jgi:hypothetical protein